MSSWEQSASKLEFDKVRQRIVRYASSEPGRRLLAGLDIMTFPGEIREELAKVSEVKRLLEQEEPLPLDDIHDIHDAAARAAVDGMVLLPLELRHVALTLKASRLVRSFAAKRREEYPHLWKLADPLHTDKVLEFNIDRAVDEAGAVRPNASKDLLAIRRAIADTYEELRKRLAGILRTVAELGFSQDEIITTREGRMVIPVKAEHKNRVPGFVHSASSSGATVFIEPTDTLELNNEIRGLQFQEQREVEKILRSLTAQVGEQKEALQANLHLLGEIDGMQAKAKYSIEIIGIEPVMQESGPVRLVQARHPILLMSHGREGVIPLDLEVGGGWTTLLISGPNAGGKSVAMKCVGLLALMAQAGLHIPAGDGTTLRIFRSCFVDIGDEQSIENDLSTFSSHLANLKRIEEQADKASLVLIDEIGAGTDPAEGGAFAAALLEELTERGAVTIATTHQGALKVFAHATEGIANGAMEFDSEALTPTYRFRGGIPGSSYALEMATRLGFSPALMARSRTILGSDHTKLDKLITEMESSAQRARSEAETARLERARLQTLVAEYEEKVGRLAGEVKELKRKAINEADEIVARANGLIEKSVREIREKNAEKETVRDIRRAFASLHEELVQQKEEVAPASSPSAGVIRPGSSVTVGEGGDVGEVAEISADGKTAVVIFGVVKIRSRFSDLRSARGRPLARPERREGIEMEKPTEVGRDLDLRGMTGEEALPLVDKFIDDAVLAGLHRIDIIHGKGTGALRKKISDFLTSHPRVRSFRLGEWNEGGTGATVVELGDS